MIKISNRIREHVVLALTPTLLSALLLLLTAIGIKVDFNTFSKWTQEDGIIEYATCLLFLFSAVSFIIASYKSQYLAHRTEWWRYGLLLAWAMLMLIFSGEEISWGQRLFNLNPPDMQFFQTNMQNEINLHNQAGLHQIKAALLNSLMISTGVLLPVAALLPAVRKVIQFLAMPSVPILYSTLFLLAFFLNTDFIYPRAAYGNAPREIAELIFSLAMFSFALHGVLSPDSLFRVFPSGSGRNNL